MLYEVITDRFLSVLPLSHTFENTLGLIFPIMNGCSIAYLRKAPTASVLMPALQKVKPTVMLVVPLIIEKVYKGKIRITSYNVCYTKLLRAVVVHSS